VSIYYGVCVVRVILAYVVGEIPHVDSPEAVYQWRTEDLGVKSLATRLAGGEIQIQYMEIEYRVVKARASLFGIQNIMNTIEKPAQRNTCREV
jgi:hypothetical protein